MCVYEVSSYSSAILSSIKPGCAPFVLDASVFFTSYDASAVFRHRLLNAGSTLHKPRQASPSCLKSSSGGLAFHGRSYKTIFQKRNAHKLKLPLIFTMEASNHSFGSVVCPVNSLRCDLFATLMWPTESYLSQERNLLSPKYQLSTSSDKWVWCISAYFQRGWH